MTEDTTYNGWKNYPTWCVNLWLSNDEGLYNSTLDLARDSQDPLLAHTRIGSIRNDLADALKTWVRDDLAPDLGATFAADLLGYALDEVDWYEIADAWLEQVSESV